MVWIVVHGLVAACCLECELVATLLRTASLVVGSRRMEYLRVDNIFVILLSVYTVHVCYVNVVTLSNFGPPRA